MAEGSSAAEQSPTGIDSQALSVKSIDVFMTYRCGLRCSHCFVGDRLDQRTDFPFAMFEKLVATAHVWRTEEITFLGGEPTLHPRLTDAIELARLSGYRTRVVTNGHHGYTRFLRAHGNRPLPVVYFSLDGSCPETHDRIRGRGSFSALVQNVKRSHQRGAALGGILSVSRDNAHDVAATLRLCDALGFRFVNVHHVSNRGFAQQDTVLSVSEWPRVCATIDDLAPTLTTSIRLERTFVSGHAFSLNCAVRAKSNLMFLPDCRVYMCMMFIDIPDSHSFTWTEHGLVPNDGVNSELRIATTGTEAGCPAFRLVNRSLVNEARDRGTVVNCIYDKDQLPSKRRKTLLTSHPSARCAGRALRPR